MLKLYGSTTSPFVRHCRIALLQEAVPFDLVLTDYAASAAQSPTARVPFMEDGDVRLTDSSAILHHIRTRAGKTFLTTSAEAEMYFLANTALDTAINLFLLERDALTDSPYLSRQKGRVSATFAELDRLCGAHAGAPDEGVWRTGCLLDWVAYRNRFDFAHLPHLVALQAELARDPHFQATAPPPQ